MALFHRDKAKVHDERPAHPQLGPGLAAAGWAPVPGPLVEGVLDTSVHEITRAMYGVPRGIGNTALRGIRVNDTRIEQVHRTELTGRAVSVANAWTVIEPEIRKPQIDFNPDHDKGVGVCAVELGTVLAVHRVESKRYALVATGRTIETGDPAFDERFCVSVLMDGADVLFTPEVRSRIMIRDDWSFVAERNLLGCVVKGPFGNGAEAAQVAQQVLDVVTGFPASVSPLVDHSTDDIIERATRITSLEEAIAFLQGLSDDERARLRASPTPLAALADARTPEEAMATFHGLDRDKKLQLMAMVMPMRKRPG
jgi:hypothetical protein